jgi:putative transposase
VKTENAQIQQIYRGYKYELDPNIKQKTLLMKHAGCARFAYNWGLEQRIKRFQENEGSSRFTTAIEQHRILVQLKQNQFKWMYEVSKCAPQEALRDLEQAFKFFWQRRRAGRKSGFPRFKKKGTNERFRLYGRIRVFEKEVQLPRIGKVRLKEQPKIKGKILSVTISKKASR